MTINIISALLVCLVICLPGLHAAVPSWLSGLVGVFTGNDDAGCDSSVTLKAMQVCVNNLLPPDETVAAILGGGTRAGINRVCSDSGLKYRYMTACVAREQKKCNAGHIIHRQFSEPDTNAAYKELCNKKDVYLNATECFRTRAPYINQCVTQMKESEGGKIEGTKSKQLQQLCRFAQASNTCTKVAIATCNPAAADLLYDAQAKIFTLRCTAWSAASPFSIGTPLVILANLVGLVCFYRV